MLTVFRALLILLLTIAATAANAAKPPILEIKGVKPEPSVFKAAKRREPLVLKSVDEAKEHFDRAGLSKLEEQVDFEKQFVLLFAWRGSGQDKLEYAVAESFPEQIHFHIKPGRTRDLRPHMHVFALRKNVKWSMK